MAPKEDNECEYFAHNRKYLRGKTTRFCNKVDRDLSEYDTVNCDQSISELRDLKNRLSSLNEKVSSRIWRQESDTTKLNAEFDSCEEYDDKIMSIIHKLEAHKIALTQNQSAANSDNHNLPHNNVTMPMAPKLPQIPLPRYGHESGELITEFFLQFEAIIGRSNLTELEKFSYLEAQLSGEPLVLVKSLQGIDKSYGEAKNLLLKAFSSPTLRKYEILDRLVALNLETPSNIYSYIGEMRSVIASVKGTDIDVDFVLQFFIWRSMPEILKNQFVHIVNKNNPDLNDITDNIFDAAERYSHTCKHIKSSPRNNTNCLTLGSRHSEDVILPTFTFGVKNGYMIRALKDTSCTNCFIRKSLAKMLNCKILNRISVTIKGMNINQLHEVVEVKFLIGNKAVSCSNCHYNRENYYRFECSSIKYCCERI